MNKEFLKMQKLAGLITESQYKKKVNENQSSGKSYKDLLDIAKQYEGDEDYVGSFKKAFQGKNTITKAEWEEWSRTLDGGYDPENYAEKNWRMAGKKLNEMEDDGFDLNAAYDASPDTHSYEDILSVVSGYEGPDFNAVESFKESFPKGKPVTKDAWEEWSRTLDGGHDPEGYAYLNWISLTDPDIYKKAGVA